MKVAEVKDSFETEEESGGEPDEIDDPSIIIRPEETVEAVYAEGFQLWSQIRKRSRRNQPKANLPLHPQQLRGPMYDVRLDPGYDRSIESALGAMRRKALRPRMPESLLLAADPELRTEDPVPVEEPKGGKKNKNKKTANKEEKDAAKKEQPPKQQQQQLKLPQQPQNQKTSKTSQKPVTVKPENNKKKAGNPNKTNNAVEKPEKGVKKAGKDGKQTGKEKPEGKENQAQKKDVTAKGRSTHCKASLFHFS